MVNEKKKVELKDEELETVTGGSHMKNGKTYSDDTYSQLGVKTGLYSSYQKGSYHPLIVTWGNSCRLEDSSCLTCPKHTVVGLTLYCLRRSEECDEAL